MHGVTNSYSDEVVVSVAECWKKGKDRRESKGIKLLVDNF